MKELEGIFPLVELYAKDKKQNIRVWSISARDFDIHFSHGLVDGVQNGEFEHVNYGKAGRSRHEQMLLQINSKIKNKIDIGYCYTMEDAKNNIRTNASGDVRPMGGKKFLEKKHTDFENYIAQYKLNGYRCFTKLNYCDEEFLSYTRKGIEITTIRHIQQSIYDRINNSKLKLLDQINELTIDGELYHHGTPLGKIISWGKKQQPDTDKLEYHIYDIYCGGANFNYKERFEIINELEECTKTEIIENFKAISVDNLNHLYGEAIVEGYEGLMVRDVTGPYQDGVRSDYLLKVKSRIGSKKTYEYEDEFIITKIDKSPKGMPRAYCLAENGKEFKVVLPGDHQEKEAAYDNMYNYVGGHMTVQFSELTEYGIPFQPIAVKFRDISFD